MKKIIKEPIKLYQATCQHCGCVFTYEFEDIDGWYTDDRGWIDCPHCGTSINHYISMEVTPYVTDWGWGWKAEPIPCVSVVEGELRL